MWVGDTIYFLLGLAMASVSLFVRHDTRTKQVAEALHSDGFDFKTASAGPDAIVLEQFGAIKLYDLATHRAVNVTIHVNGVLARCGAQPHFAKVERRRIQSFWHFANRKLSARCSLRLGGRFSRSRPIKATSG